MTQSTSSTIVVGTGIIGASIAWHLAQAGHRVTLIGPEDGGLATPTSFSWINASWGNAPHYARFRMRAMAEWDRLAGDLPGLPYRQTGGLTFDLDEEDLRSYQREHASLGYRLAPLDAAGVAGVEPHLALTPGFALHALDEGAAEPVEAARMLIGDAVSRDVERIAANVDSLVGEDGRIAGVRIGERILKAGHVVLAAGMATAQLARSVGVNLPLSAPPGLIVHSRPFAKRLNGLIISRELHMRQTLSGRIIAGSDFGGSDPGDYPTGVAQALFGKVKAALKDSADLELEHYTIGHRPTPKDGLPVIGRISSHPGLYLAVMHSGVTLAPLVGALVAREITRETTEAELDAFRPGRFD